MSQILGDLQDQRYANYLSKSLEQGNLFDDKYMHFIVYAFHYAYLAPEYRQ